jgi:hypothetical protein
MIQPEALLHQHPGGEIFLYSQVQAFKLVAYSNGKEAGNSFARGLWKFCLVRAHASLEDGTSHEICIETESYSSLQGLSI